MAARGKKERGRFERPQEGGADRSQPGPQLAWLISKGSRAHSDPRETPSQKRNMEERISAGDIN